MSVNAFCAEHWTLSRSNWNLEVLVLRRGENRSTRRKTSRSKDENQKQTQPTYDTESGNRTWATLVGGEYSHHCAIPAPRSPTPCSPLPKTLLPLSRDRVSRLWVENFDLAPTPTRLRTNFSQLVETCDLLQPHLTHFSKICKLKPMREKKSLCKYMKYLIFEGPLEYYHFLENFRIIRNVFRNLRASSEIFLYSRVVFENPGNSQYKNLMPGKVGSYII